MSAALAVGVFVAGTMDLRAADPPPATIGSAAITQEDLERAVGSRLTRIRTEEYNVKRAILDELIAERLLRRSRGPILPISSRSTPASRTAFRT